MRPDHPGFLKTWVDLARDVRPAVAFGGFSLLQAPQDARFAVHRHMAARSDCIPAAQRAEQPEKYVFTSNLLVRRDVFDTETFDSGFSRRRYNTGEKLNIHWLTFDPVSQG